MRVRKPQDAVLVQAGDLVEGAVQLLQDAVGHSLPPLVVRESRAWKRLTRSRVVWTLLRRVSSM